MQLPEISWPMRDQAQNEPRGTGVGPGTWERRAAPNPYQASNRISPTSSPKLGWEDGLIDS